MHPDLDALLELQSEDVAIAVIEERMLDLAARVNGLDRECEQIAGGIEQAMSAVEVEEKKRRDLQGKLEQHKQLQERNLAQLDQVRKAKEAVAANTQIDLTRKVLAQEESDLRDISTRIQSLREVAELQQMELADITERQRSARVEIGALRAELDRQLKVARTKREGAAMRVSRPVLAKYERIRTRERSGAMYAIRGAACGRCNTAIPLQRRNIIASGRSIEVCEGCGVLLYAAV